MALHAGPEPLPRPTPATAELPHGQDRAGTKHRPRNGQRRHSSPITNRSRAAADHSWAISQLIVTETE